jgi:hypothetical protein
MFSKKANPSTMKGLQDTMALFAGKRVQNNCSETVNSILDRTVSLQGNRYVGKLERRIRTFFIIQNNGMILHGNALGLKHRSSAYLNRIFGLNTKEFQHRVIIRVH